MPESNQKNNQNRSALLKYAVNILSRRPYFFEQLKKKLQQRAITLELSNFDSDLNSVLSDLKDGGYLKDDYLAEAYVRRCLGKGQGPKIIQFKLAQLGLSSAQISSALSTEESKQALNEAKSKITAKMKGQEDFKVRHKLYQRGF